MTALLLRVLSTCLHLPRPCPGPRHAAASQAGSTHGAMLQSVVDVRHNLTLQDGAFLLYVESAVPLFALALQVCCCAEVLYRGLLSLQRPC